MFKNSFFHVRFLVLAVVSTTAFLSCFTAKKAAKQADKIQAKKPVVMASKCNQYYPIVESTKIYTVIDSKNYDSIKAAFDKYVKETNYQNNALQQQIGAALANPNCDAKNEIIQRLNNALAEQKAQCNKLANAPPIIKYVEKQTTKESSAKLSIKQREIEDKLNEMDKARIAELSEKQAVQKQLAKSIENEKQAVEAKGQIRKNFWLTWLGILLFVAGWIFKKYIKTKVGFLKNIIKF